jgi:hypothetical protein
VLSYINNFLHKEFNSCGKNESLYKRRCKRSWPLSYIGENE